jgi:hypothetical protein
LGSEWEQNYNPVENPNIKIQMRKRENPKMTKQTYPSSLKTAITQKKL